MHSVGSAKLTALRIRQVVAREVRGSVGCQAEAKLTRLARVWEQMARDILA